MCFGQAFDKRLCPLYHGVFEAQLQCSLALTIYIYVRVSYHFHPCQSACNPFFEQMAKHDRPLVTQMGDEAQERRSRPFFGIDVAPVLGSLAGDLGGGDAKACSWVRRSEGAERQTFVQVG